MAEKKKYPWNKGLQGLFGRRKEIDQAKAVYAGPEYFARRNGRKIEEDPEGLNDVYAGPEFFEEHTYDGKEDGGRVYEGPENYGTIRPERPEDMEKPVYAGPEFFEQPTMLIYAGPEYYNKKEVGSFIRPLEPIEPMEIEPALEAPEEGYMICPCCGSKVPDSARFCPECGSPLKKPEPAPDPDTVPETEEADPDTIPESAEDDPDTLPESSEECPDGGTEPDAEDSASDPDEA